MSDLFKQRKHRFIERCLKYLRYVLNDHFVLFLLVFIGFLAVQYSQLSKNIPENRLALYLGVFLFLIALLFIGNIATYLERPDKYFLLTKEKEIGQIIQQQTISSLLFGGIIQALGWLLVLPLMLSLGMPVVFIIGLLFIFIAVRVVYLNYRKKELLTKIGINWDVALLREEKRQQSILRFFALFTNVKGISNSIKRRKYLDGFLTIFSKKQENTWKHLFLRSYFRNGDLFPLTLRLLGISLIGLALIPQVWVGVGLTLLMNYLLLFQLLALYGAFDYQQLTLLFPLDKKFKISGLLAVLRLVGGSVLLLEMVLALFIYKEFQAVLVLFVGSLALLYLYLPFKVKSLVDESF